MRTTFGIAIALLLVAPAAGAFSLKMEDIPPIAIEDPRRAAEPWSTVRILTDIAGAEIGGVLLIEGVAEARSGYVLRDVEIWVDRQPVGRATGTESWSYLLDTTRLLDGAHSLDAIAWAAPDLPFTLILEGSSHDVDFSTLNHLTGALLFEHTYDMTGASLESWTYVLDQDYTGLRVTLETKAGSRSDLAAPRGEIVITYADGPDDEDPLPRHVWIASWGLGGGAVVRRSAGGLDDSDLHEGEVLALGGAFAGDGRVTLRVEALPVDR